MCYDVKTWQIENYTNEWGEKENLSFVIGTFEGTFSNSVATDEPLKVELLINKKDISMYFYEYGHMLQKSDGEAYIKVRDKDKNEDEARYENYFRNGQLVLYGHSQAMVRKALLKGGRVMFKIIIRDNGILVGSYRFEVPKADGLKETLAKTRYFK